MKPSKMTVDQLLAVLTEHAPMISAPPSQTLEAYLVAVTSLMLYRMTALACFRAGVPLPMSLDDVGQAVLSADLWHETLRRDRAELN